MNIEDQLKNLFYSSCPEGVIVFDQEKTIHIWNPAMEALFGIEATEAIGKKTDHKRMPAFFRDNPTTFVEEALRGKSLTITHSDDEERVPMLEISYFPLIQTNGKLAGGTALFKKVSKQIQLQKAAKSIQSQLHDVLETMSESFVALDKSWHYTYVNHHAANFFKVPQEFLIGKNIWELFPNIKKTEVYKRFHQVMKERKPLYFESFIPDLNKWFGNRVFPVSNGIVVFLRDITKEKRQREAIEKLNVKLEDQNKNLIAQEEELRAQQEDLMLSLSQLEERNFELDQIIYKTSHDIRSPLTSMMGLVNLVKAETDVSKIKSYILLIENRITKLDEFVKSMLNFSKVSRTPVEKETIDFNKIIHECFKSLEFIPSYNKIEKEIKVEGGPFKGDSLRLKIIFTNLISNAVKYVNPHQEAPYIKIHITIHPHQAIIRMQDNGIGIKAEYLPKVMNMFFRGTDRLEGSGLGLYIVKQTIEKLGGQILIESIEGKGTNIELQIPSKLEELA